MRYPHFIKDNSIIGICAPSDGITNEIKIKRLNYAIKNLEAHGFKIMETKSVRNSILGKSNHDKLRAYELDELYKNEKVKLIICAAGGDFLQEMLPFINFDTVCNNLKWIQGYSDITSLLYTITTKYDIATIYGYNIGTFGMKKWHQSIIDNINILTGKNITQNSYDYYEDQFYKYIIGDEEFRKDMPVKWEILNFKKEINIKGRIIGGCLDVLLDIFGTPYDYTLNFIEKYKNDGIIWYFDNYGLSSEDLIKAFWKLKICGYFKYTKGIIFGRNMIEESYYNISFKAALEHSLKELNVPIIYNADIGHKQPSMTIINGSIATIWCNNEKGTIKQELL